MVTQSPIGRGFAEQKIIRPATKATNESEVSEADRAKHEASEAFAEFYARIKTEAAKLQALYQPQLREGIVLNIELINPVQEDEKDGDVDVKVGIRPNAIIESVNIYFNASELENTLPYMIAPDKQIYQAGIECVPTGVRKMRIYLLQDSPSWRDKGNNKLFLGEFTSDLSQLSLAKRVQVLKNHIVSNNMSATKYAKHTQGNTEEKRKWFSLSKGQGQYLASLSDVDIENLEKQAFTNPDYLEDKDSVIYAFKRFSYPIGYEGIKGKDPNKDSAVYAYTIRAEMTAINYDIPSVEVHSHPKNK